MRPENQRMKEWLAEREIDAMPKRFYDGSVKHSWRLYNLKIKWTPELWEKLTALGFTNLWFKPLGQYDGNGGVFSVFVRGHDELV